MKNTIDNNIETSLDIAQEYKENPEMEALWKKTFQDQYKPDTTIDFQQIKDFLIERNKEDEYRKMRNYNYHIMNPMILCDIFIKTGPKQLSISFLESLPNDIKQCLADLLLETWPFNDIQKNLGTAMLFWIWHHCYYFSNKRNEKLKDFFINSTSFIGSEKNYNLLEKAYTAQKGRDIHTTLLLFGIATHLQEDISDGKIDEYLQNTLGKTFSLSALYPRNEHTKGHEEERSGKDTDSNGNTIDPDSINKTSIYTEYTLKGRYLKIPNRQNPDIYKNRSGMTYKVYLDGPMGIGLFHNNKPIALISFSLQDSQTVFIHQIQALNTKYFDRYGRTIQQKTDTILQTIPWQKTLYDIVLLLAKKYQCKNIVIQSGEENPRIDILREELQYDEYKGKLVQVTIDQPHLSLDIAKQIYDVFAKKQGFKQNKTTKNRDKKI